MVSVFYFFIAETATKQVNEYKVKLQKADQEISTLQATVLLLTFQSHLLHGYLLCFFFLFTVCLIFHEGVEIGNAGDPVPSGSRNIREGRR